MAQVAVDRRPLQHNMVDIDSLAKAETQRQQARGATAADTGKEVLIGVAAASDGSDASDQGPQLRVRLP